MATVAQIVAAVAAKIATVTPANSYTSNLASKVFTYRRTPLDGNETLAVYVGHGAKTADGPEFGPRRRVLPVHVDVVAKGDSADSLIHDAVREIEIAFRADMSIGGVARFCTFDFSDHEIDQLEKKAAGQRLTVNVTYTETDA